MSDFLKVGLVAAALALGLGLLGVFGASTAVADDSCQNGKHCLWKQTGWSGHNDTFGDTYVDFEYHYVFKSGGPHHPARSGKNRRNNRRLNLYDYTYFPNFYVKVDCIEGNGVENNLSVDTEYFRVGTTATGPSCYA